MQLKINQVKENDMVFVCGYARGAHLGTYINLKPKICRIHLKPNRIHSHLTRVSAKVGKKEICLGEYSVDLSLSKVFKENSEYTLTELLDESITAYNLKVRSELKRLDQHYATLKAQIVKSLM